MPILPSMVLETFLAISILGPIPPFHLFFHFFLKFWQKHPPCLYLLAGLIWIFFIFSAWHWARFPAVFFLPPFWLKIFSRLIALGAFFVFLWAVKTLGPKYFFLWAALRPTAVRQEYIKKGPYRFLSHPAYAAYITAVIAVFFATGQVVLFWFALYIIISMLVVIKMENRELQKRLEEF